MGVGSFVEDLRNFVELTHVVSVTNAVWWTSSRLFLFARQRKLAYLTTIKKGAIKSIESLKQRKVRYSQSTLIRNYNLLTGFLLTKTLGYLTLRHAWKNLEMPCRKKKNASSINSSGSFKRFQNLRLFTPACQHLFNKLPRSSQVSRRNFYE